ncbi:MAG: hypothetical protein ACR2GE_01680 [Pseudonocardia sp.]
MLTKDSCPAPPQLMRAPSLLELVLIPTLDLDEMLRPVAVIVQPLNTADDVDGLDDVEVGSPPDSGVATPGTAELHAVSSTQASRAAGTPARTR